MKQKLWTMAFVLALTRTRLDLCHGGTEEDGTLETQWAASISTRINHAARQPPAHGSLERFLVIQWNSLVLTDNSTTPLLRYCYKIAEHWV